MWNGLCGRLVIAVEPVICTAVFGALTAGLIFRPLPLDAHLTRYEAALIISPVFGLAALAFLIYAIVLLAGPLRALAETYAPVFVVDGYVRYRGPELRSPYNVNGYIAVLDDRRRALAEWPSYGEASLPDYVRPALVEFTNYGGIHRLDGRSTGVLPESIGTLGVGAARTAPKV